MIKSSPSEFAHLGFSCFIQSGYESELCLQALCSSSSSSTDDILLTAATYQKQGSDCMMSNSNISLEWFIEPSEEKEYFHLVSAANHNHPMLLHLGENFEQNGDPITLVEKNHAYENTKIRFDEVPGLEGFYYMTFFKASGMGSRTSDSRRVVHVDQQTKRVTQWEKMNSPACFWRFIPAHLSPLVSANDQSCFAIANKNGGFMNLKGGSIFNGTQVTVSPYTNQMNFKWKIKLAPQMKDQYFVVSARDGHHDRVLQQRDNSQDDNAKITLWEIDASEPKAAANAMVRFEPAQDECGHWCMIFCQSNRYIQFRLGELSQIRRKREQPIEANWCWSFFRCIPHFPKNA